MRSLRSIALLISVAFVALAFLAPAATARPDLPPVYACVNDVTHADCWDGGDACVGFSYQIPQCVDVACYPIDCIAIEKPDLPPLVGVCVDRVTTNYGCYHDSWICVGFSYQVPQCIPHVEITNSCMEIYRKMTVGPVTYVSRNSCSHEVYVNGEPLLG